MIRARATIVATLSVGLLATTVLAPGLAGAVQRGPAATALMPLAPGDWTGSRNKAAGGGVNQAETTISTANAQAIHIVNHIPSTRPMGGPQSAATGHGLLYAGLPGGGIGAYDLIGWTRSGRPVSAAT